MDIRSIYHLETAECIPLDVELAGLCNRILAFLLDLLVLIMLVSGLFIGLKIISVISPEFAQTVFNLLFQRGTARLPFWMVVVSSIFGVSALAFAYHFFLEWLWNGKTVGKHLMKIRVVRQNGQPIGLWESFGRNIIRFFLDVYPVAFGLYPMMISGTERRFGDFMVGTLVINDQLIRRPVLPDSTAQPGGTSIGGPDAPGQNMTPEEFDLLRSFISRQKGFSKNHRQRLAEAFSQYFQNRLHIQNDTRQPHEFLAQLVRDYQGSTVTTETTDQGIPVRYV